MIAFHRAFRVFAAGGVSLAAAAALHNLASAAAPKFYDDDPIAVVRDTQNASKIRRWKIDLCVDLPLNLFYTLGDPTPNVRAKNINTIDEVPDSSWFTNRIGARPLTPDEVAKGPDATRGPAPGSWAVVSSKTDGVTPGFTVRDSTGDLWFLKFDPPRHRGMATGSEIVVTKLFWTLGYYVPESHIAHLRREQLVVGEGATYEVQAAAPCAASTRRPMRPSDIDALLARADREPDGSYRVIAGRGLPKIGEFRFYGTNPDDPNDIVPHEHRRELRAYSVYSAWLNHVDAKAGNTLDALITENGRTFVRHYLQDFGSTLGSGALAPAEYWEGNEYLFDTGDVVKQMVGFGFVFPDWHTKKFYEAPAIGRLPLDNTRFDPDRWKPRVPNQSFLRARADDRFWAAHRLLAVTDDMLRAAVRTGEFNDAQSEVFLVKALAERRDAIVRKYLPAVNPITDLALSDSVLTFRNAAVDADFARPPAAYRAVWSVFDNATGATRPVGETSSPAPRISVPPDLPSSSDVFIRVDVSASAAASPSWQRPVHAYFRRQNGAWRLVGFERLPEG